MRILFCSNPLSYKDVDIDYKNEYEACKQLNIATGLINFEELVYYDNPIKSVKMIESIDSEELAFYRGWMLKPEQYEKLYNALLTKNIRLINSPDEYKHCHHLPESYPVIKSLTPKTEWLHQSQFEDMNNVWKLFKSFCDSPVIIKDYVKSRKHDWLEACYIPNASDEEHVSKVVNKFIQLQGEELNEGIVVREFVELEFLTNHSKSHMPLTKEFRLFFLNGKLIQTLKYWDEGEYNNLQPELEPFLEIASNIKSNFFTMDIAKLKAGKWIIIEVGDGQVSGLPDNADIVEFYKSLTNTKGAEL